MQINYKMWYMSENISFISYFINNYHKCLSIYRNYNTSFFFTIGEKERKEKEKNIWKKSRLISVEGIAIEW